MSYAILLIDDDAGIRDIVERGFAHREWQIVSAADAHAGIEAFAAGTFDLVLLDLHLPGMSGLDVLKVLRERDAHVAVIMLTAYGDIQTAVHAMQLGAENFVSKPFDLMHLEALVHRALEKSALRHRSEFLLQRHAEAHPLAALGSSPAMRDVAASIEVVAPSDATVLLLGETGTGKGWTAELIHSLSPRARGPFVDINCAGLSATFLESELFGHEKGAFTDARALKRGLFEVANGGTLFLDEIGDLAIELQPKLLKVLEARRFRRLGSNREISVDVRLITASNHDLKALVTAGRFREDLFYRIAGHVIVLPPLRDRGDDAILDLALHMLAPMARQRGRPPLTISSDALTLMLRHSWPGNVRELRNTLEYAMLHAGDEPLITPAMLPPDLAPRRGHAHAEPATQRDLHTFLDQAERTHIIAALDHAGGNRSLAARNLGISRATLYEKLKRHGLSSD